MKPTSTKTRVALAVILLVFVVRIAATHPVLTDTFDEAWHISAGLDYLRTGSYDYEPQHPPLGRLAIALLPYWYADLKLGPFEDPWSNDWVEKDLDFYWWTLSLARVGNLPFGILLILVTFLWSRDLFGERVGLVAALIASCSPNLLAHAGLAALDIATASTYLAACYATWLWSRTGRWRYCFLASACASAAFLSKFSTLGFLPPVVVAFLFLGSWERTQGNGKSNVLNAKLASQLAVFAVCGCMLCWAIYRFDVGSLSPSLNARVQASPIPPYSPERIFVSLLGDAQVPAPAFWQGIIDVMRHNRGGHRAYLLGEIYQDGRWHYFPIALALKTPLPFLILATLGVIYLSKQRAGIANPVWALVFPVAVILGGSVYTNINIGIRHILPLYPFLAILAAAPFKDGIPLRRPMRKASVLLALLLAWHVIESAAAHPDYLAYFNQVVRGQEEEYLADSNLDWGQDLARLAEFVEDRDIERILAVYTGRRPIEKFGIPQAPLMEDDPECCWVAAGVNQVKIVTGPPMADLDGRQPMEKVGKSIFVYQIPPGDEFWKRRSIKTGRQIRGE